MNKKTQALLEEINVINLALYDMRKNFIKVLLLTIFLIMISFFMQHIIPKFNLDDLDVPIFLVKINKLLPYLFKIAPFIMIITNLILFLAGKSRRLYLALQVRKNLHISKAQFKEIETLYVYKSYFDK